LLYRLLVRFTGRVIEGAFVPTTDHLNACGPAQETLHQLAADCAARRFGHQVFVRAVVEVSNFCRENCIYCGMRRDNRALTRFRARTEQLIELLVHHRPASVTDVNIQTGEDPVVVREVVLPLIEALRRETGLGVSVCLGTLSPALCQELKQAGASFYIIKFEIAASELYSRMAAPGTLEERVAAIEHLAATGWNVSSGFIAGLPGQSGEDTLANLALARRLPLAGCSVSPFIPGEETPLKDAPMAEIDLTLNCMAALRLMRPEWIIPSVSALNLAEPGAGYRRGLRAGANLVTINLTPSEIRGDYLLYKRKRFIMTEERILSAISAEGLSASQESLEHYLEKKAGTRVNGSARGLEEHTSPPGRPAVKDSQPL
jgi:biotin synthase